MCFLDILERCKLRMPSYVMCSKNLFAQWSALFHRVMCYFLQKFHIIYIWTSPTNAHMCPSIAHCILCPLCRLIRSCASVIYVEHFWVSMTSNTLSPHSLNVYLNWTIKMEMYLISYCIQWSTSCWPFWREATPGLYADSWETERTPGTFFHAWN